MPTVSTPPLYIDALVANLKLRAGLTGVGVFAAPPGIPFGDEAIVFVDCTDNIDWAAIGKQRQSEGYTWSGAIRVSKGGAGEVVAKAARDRVYALLNEVKDEVRLNPNQGLTASGVMHSKVSREILRQRLDDGNRLVWMEFDIAVVGRIGS